VYSDQKQTHTEVEEQKKNNKTENVLLTRFSNAYSPGVIGFLLPLVMITRRIKEHTAQKNILHTLQLPFSVQDFIREKKNR